MLHLIVTGVRLRHSVGRQVVPAAFTCQQAVVRTPAAETVTDVKAARGRAHFSLQRAVTCQSYGGKVFFPDSLRMMKY